ncbi:MAG: glycosyltransferase family 39 protein, partial [Deltaproteobacteria bacterium]|nr:glycosyltransferase family 39 protein [Deltaproteobacteria bacterium]
MLSLPRKFHWILFSLLLLLGGYLRSFAFFMPSNVGDPPSYQALAMKMNYGFMRNYNVFNYRMASGTIPGTVDYVWEENPQKWTSMRTRASNRRPLNMQPPLLPTLMWLSHGLFKHGGPYSSVAQNQGSKVLERRPWEFFRAQGYAIAVPYLFSLLTLAAVYAFCLYFFSWKEGLIAVALLAVSPLELAVGAKLYTDGIVTSLTFTSLLFFLIALEKEGRSGLLWAALAGLLLGLAFLAKLQAILFAAGFVMAGLLNPRQKAPWYRRLVDPRLL